MAMRFAITYRAGEHEVFAPDAFARQIGAEVPFNVGGRHVGNGTLVVAAVARDGQSVELVFETSETPAGRGVAEAGKVSLTPIPTVPKLPPCEVCGFSAWPPGGMHAARSIHMRAHERVRERTET